MTSKIQSLGDEASETLVVSESHPLPAGRKNLIASLEAILSSGGVQKITVELGKPIRVRRQVRKVATTDVPVELIDDDIYAAARNASMMSLELPSNYTPLDYLWKAFDNFSADGVRVRAVLVPTKAQLAEWLNKDLTKSTELFGAEIVEDKNIPDETILVVAANKDDPESIVSSLRLGMDVPSLRRKKR